ncbi:membrane protein [Bacteroides gallinarum]|uniref:membrane protein n=1 Tax=Bacteroides gallinarum TaxID=376806 RepID=UPI000368D86C|nr:membrane protein [Bacteroides gallinarum]
MGKQRVLSSKFNMSLGYIPVIISIILCEFIIQDTAIYIGTGIGLLSSIYMLRRKGSHIPQIILYSTTGMLLLLTITSFFSTDYCPEAMFPFTLEISAIIPPLIIFLNRKRFLDYHTAQSRKCCKQFFAQGAEAAIVSARVLLLIGFLHLLIISLAILISHPLNDTARYVLFHIMPPCVFILSILFNQFGIYYFNKVMKHTVFVPIVTTKGDVIGKAMASEAISRKNEYINPVIRITAVSHGMLFLLPRPQCSTLEKGKTDILTEGYLIYGETLEQGAKRVLQQTLPTASLQNLRFNLTYHFENELTNRLVYLFTLDVDDDSLLCNKELKGGKLWTFRQIEHNLHRNFFSSCFEYEYEYTKEIIYTREKYKES